MWPTLPTNIVCTLVNTHSFIPSTHILVLTCLRVMILRFPTFRAPSWCSLMPHLIRCGRRRLVQPYTCSSSIHIYTPSISTAPAADLRQQSSWWSLPPHTEHILLNNSTRSLDSLHEHSFFIHFSKTAVGSAPVHTSICVDGLFTAAQHHHPPQPLCHARVNLATPVFFDDDRPTSTIRTTTLSAVAKLRSRIRTQPCPHFSSSIFSLRGQPQMDIVDSLFRLKFTSHH